MAEEPATEEWRLVEGWPDYEVSSTGRIRRRTAAYIANFRSGRRHIRSPIGFVLTPFLDRDGYPRVVLAADGVKKQRIVSALVCAAFHGQRPTAAHQAAHWDGNRTNNRPENLRWATQLENSADMIRHGTSMRGERSARAILGVSDVLAIRESLRNRRRISTIAAEYGVGIHTIYAIKYRKNWGWLVCKHQ